MKPKYLNKPRPSSAQLQKELSRVNYVSRYRAMLKNTVSSILTTAAVAVLVATLWMPVLKIYGNSMAPTLQNGDFLICIKTSEMAPGDIIAFTHNNKLLVKRIIAQSGDWVDIQQDGTVLLNQEPLTESYIVEKAMGQPDISLPCQVPEGCYFVMGDHRSTSVDSRYCAVGCISQEQLLGKVLLRVWPLDSLGFIS